MDIGKRITYFRTQKDYSTNKLAYMAGISQSYLRDVELGNKNPTIAFLTLVCDALDISLATFFNEEDTSSENDPLILKIQQLTPEQKQTLLAFLNTI